PLPKPKWDEMCFQWCKQQDRKRKENKAPDCKMICFKRLLDQNKKAKDENNNNSWKIKLRKIDDIDGNNGDIAKTLYDKNTTSLNGGNNNNNDCDHDHDHERSNNIKRKNFLDGYCIYYVKGLENCDKHVESMKSADESLNRNLWLQNESEEYEIDLGDKLEQAKLETTRVIKRAFTPGFQLAKRYFESWSDGTQFSFFRKFYHSAQRMDAVHLVQENVKKA
ncbi:6433_t:CDS:2, partial [Entrophospora sp. SA101]